jgi:hypothetical protein
MVDLMFAVARWLPMVALLGCALIVVVIAVRWSWHGDHGPVVVWESASGVALGLALMVLVSSWITGLVGGVAAQEEDPIPALALLGVLEGLLALLVLCGVVMVPILAVLEVVDRRERAAAVESELKRELGAHGLALCRLREVCGAVPALTGLTVPGASRRLWVRPGAGGALTAVAAFDVEPEHDWQMRVTVWHLGRKTAHRASTSVLAPPGESEVTSLMDAGLGERQAGATEIQELAEQLEQAWPRAARGIRRRDKGGSLQAAVF